MSQDQSSPRLTPSSISREILWVPNSLDPRGRNRTYLSGGARAANQMILPGLREPSDWLKLQYLHCTAVMLTRQYADLLGIPEWTECVLWGAPPPPERPAPTTHADR